MVIKSKAKDRHEPRPHVEPLFLYWWQIVRGIMQRVRSQDPILADRIVRELLIKGIIHYSPRHNLSVSQDLLTKIKKYQSGTLPLLRKKRNKLSRDQNSLRFTRERYNAVLRKIFTLPRNQWVQRLENALTEEFWILLPPHDLMFKIPGSLTDSQISPLSTAIRNINSARIYENHRAKKIVGCFKEETTAWPQGRGGLTVGALATRLTAIAYNLKSEDSVGPLLSRQKD
jgi:hypothetical protein